MALRTALPHSLPSNPCTHHAVLIADAGLLWVHQALMTGLPRNCHFQAATVPTMPTTASQMPRWHHSQVVCLGQAAFDATEQVWPTHGICCI